MPVKENPEHQKCLEIHIINKPTTSSTRHGGGCCRKLVQYITVPLVASKHIRRHQQKDRAEIFFGIKNKIYSLVVNQIRKRGSEFQIVLHCSTAVQCPAVSYRMYLGRCLSSSFLALPLLTKLVTALSRPLDDDDDAAAVGNGGCTGSDLLSSMKNITTSRSCRCRTWFKASI